MFNIGLRNVRQHVVELCGFVNNSSLCVAGNIRSILILIFLKVKLPFPFDCFITDRRKAIYQRVLGPFVSNVRRFQGRAILEWNGEGFLCEYT